MSGPGVSQISSTEIMSEVDSSMAAAWTEPVLGKRCFGNGDVPFLFNK